MRLLIFNRIWVALFARRLFERYFFHFGMLQPFKVDLGHVCYAQSGVEDGLQMVSNLGCISGLFF